HELSWSEAARGLWPQTLTGLAMFTALWLSAPVVLPWASPVILALVLSIPFAWGTSRRSFGGFLARHRVCATPEELARQGLGLAKSPQPPHAGSLELQTGEKAA
ncbi:MAG: hypothetical protein KDH19_19210, partial [Geminicoccaceae bacterium]|nr:hypothetical protein [Geminicoccaceae bacterium]